MKIDAAKIIERRRADQRHLVDRAEKLARGLSPVLGVRAVVVFGSVARGDFNVWSDVDVLVVAENLPPRFLERSDALGPRPALVQPVAWTPKEYRLQLARNNPIAIEAAAEGVWLVGAAGDLVTG